MRKRIPISNFSIQCWIVCLMASALTVASALGQSTSVVAWGASSFYSTNVPTGLMNVEAVAAGSDLFLALSSNGRVVAWGANNLGQTNVPSGMGNVVAISAGQDFGLALDESGNVHGWGDTNDNQFNFPPTTLARVGISAGYDSGLAIQSDGTVSVSGDDTFGEANIPLAASNIVAIAAGDGFNLALRSDGTVIAWGNDLMGGTDVPAGLTNIVAVSAEEDDAFALQANGLVVGWGTDYYGQGGVIPGVSNIISISGDLALQSNGVVVPLGEAIDEQVPVPAGLTNIVAVNGGEGDGIALIATGPPSVSPTISEVAYSGSSTLLTSSATGAYPLSYQWLHNGVNIHGATRSWLILTNLQTINSGGYSVKVTNVFGATTSFSGPLTVVNSAPIITGQPTNMMVPSGNTAAFSVTAIGSQPLSFQWRFGGSAIPGATNASLLIPGVTNTGQYSVLITNAYGSILSSNAALTFTPSVIAVWGPPTQVTNIPANLTNAVEIANAGSFALALTANGSVVGWGDDTYGETDLQFASLRNVTQLAVNPIGNGFSLAVANGTVFASGDNSFAECNVPYLTNAIYVIAGQIPMALKADGTVVEWGDFATGNEIVPAGLSNVIAIAQGNGGNLALQSNGKVVAWGFPYYGLTNVPPDLSNAVAIAVGTDGDLALSANGQITAWGIVTNIPSGLTNVVGISAQPNDSFAFFSAVTASGAVKAWGEGLFGGMPQGQLATNVPVSISNAATVFLQPYGGLTLNQNGTVSGWGNDGYEGAVPLWLTNVAAVSGPMALEGHVPPEAMPTANEFAYSGSTAILTANATGFPLNYQWQLNGVNIPGANQPWLILTNVQPPPPFVRYTVIVSNAYGSVTNKASLTVGNSAPIIQQQPQSLELPPDNNFTFSVNTIGSQPMTYQWQFNGTNIQGATGPSFTVTNAQLPAAGYYSVIAGNSFGMVTSSSAGLSFSITSVAVWGFNDEGELNVFSNLTDVLAVAAGNDHDLALLAGGTVVGWGDNTFGQTQTPSNLTNATAIAAGIGYSLALKADGTVSAWGLDSFGQVDVPPGLSNVAAIAAGGYAGMALQSNGVVKVWGFSIVTNVPSSVSNVESIAATAEDCLVLRSNGTVVEWGDDTFGQVEFASTLTNIIALGPGAGSYCNTAVKADGTVVVWGYLPDSSLEPPSGLSNVVAVAAGPDFCLAILANRTAVAWGDDAFDDLDLPPGLTNVTQIGCGDDDGIILDPVGGVITLVPSGTALPGQSGYLQATITPPAAAAAGAGWGIIGQPYFSSNTNFTVLVSAGQSVALAFQSVTGWDVPQSRAVVIPMGGLTNINIPYSVESPVMSAIPGSGFGLTGTINTAYRVQYSTNLANGPWLTLSTNTLGQGFNKIAPWPPTNHTPATYYRAVWLP